MSFIQAEMNRLRSLIQFRHQYPSISFKEIAFEDLENPVNKHFAEIRALMHEKIHQATFQEDFPAYSNFVLRHRLDFYERMLLILTLVPHLVPHFLEFEMLKNKHNPFGKQISEEQNALMGLVRGESSQAYLATGLTFIYLLEGDNLVGRSRQLSEVLSKKYFLLQEDYIQIDEHHPAEPLCSGVLWMPRVLILELLSRSLSQKNTDQL